MRLDMLFVTHSIVNQQCREKKSVLINRRATKRKHVASHVLVHVTRAACDTGCRGKGMYSEESFKS